MKKIDPIKLEVIRHAFISAAEEMKTNLMRTGYPQDIAYASLFFASGEANWITGQVLTVDGGVDAGTRTLWEYEK